MNKIKFIALSAIAPVCAFADGSGSGSTMDTTASASMVQSATSGLTSLLTACVPYVTGLFLAGLAIWGAFVIFKLIKRAFSRAT